MAESAFPDGFAAELIIQLGNTLQGNLGTSIVFRRPVMELALERMPVTLSLVTYATIFSLLLTVPLAIAAAINQNKWGNPLSGRQHSGFAPR